MINKYYAVIHTDKWNVVEYEFDERRGIGTPYPYRREGYDHCKEWLAEQYPEATYDMMFGRKDYADKRAYYKNNPTSALFPS